jgi:hypothetical protein
MKNDAITSLQWQQITDCNYYKTNLDFTYCYCVEPNVLILV